MELPHFAELLERQLDGIVRLTHPQVSRLHSHFALLVKWNQRLNLTSLRSAQEIVIRHYCESIFFGVHMPNAPDGTTIADLGAGAGFPGAPMAVLRPGWQLTLIESHQRKAVFLRESTRGWHNVSVVSGRWEDVAERFEYVVSRAVRPEDVLTAIPQLGGRVGLLLGEGDVSKVRKRSDILWNEPIPTRWGERRICAYGVCST